MLASICITLSLVCLLLSLLVYKYLTWHFKIWQKLGLSGPKPKIIYGNFPSMITGKQLTAYDIDETYRAYKHEYRAIGVFRTRNPEILILDPSLAREILISQFSKFRDNQSSEYVFSKKHNKYAARNPFFATWPDWKDRRTDAMPGLSSNRLSLSYPIWQASCLKLRKFLKQQFEGSKVTLIDAKDIAYRYTLDVMCDFLWGTDVKIFDCANSCSNIILEMAKEMLAQAAVAEDCYVKFNLLLFLKRFFNVRVFPEKTDKFFTEYTKDAMALRQCANGTHAERVDFLNYLLELKKKKSDFTHDDAVGHMLTVLLDGYETSAVVIYHTLFYLAKYPHHQDTLRSEIFENLGEDQSMSFQKLNSLQFLNQCVQETLRMITPLPKISRICTESTEISLSETERIPIAVGMTLTIPVFSYHHDKDYFSQPYEYNPERFSNNNSDQFTKQGIFLPFGDGPRICLGMRLALLEIKSCLVEILHRYHVSCSPQTLEMKKPDSRGFIFGLEGDFSLYFEEI